MKNRIAKPISIALVLVLMLTLMAGCGAGVSQEEYDEAIAEREIANTQIAELETKLAAVQVKTSIFPTISIYDGEDLLEIAIEDILNYHGDLCPNAVTAFRATQLAISELWGDEIPKRGDFRIISANPGPCPTDIFEFITRALSRGEFMYELPEWHTAVEGIPQHHAPISADCFRFTFVRKSTNEAVTIQVREDVFPEGFFKLFKKVKFDQSATPEEKKAFGNATKKWAATVKQWPLEKIFSTQEGHIEGKLVGVKVKVVPVNAENVMP